MQLRTSLLECAQSREPEEVRSRLSKGFAGQTPIEQLDWRQLRCRKTESKSSRRWSFQDRATQKQSKILPDNAQTSLSTTGFVVRAKWSSSRKRRRPTRIERL